MKKRETNKQKVEKKIWTNRAKKTIKGKQKNRKRKESKNESGGTGKSHTERGKRKEGQEK